MIKAIVDFKKAVAEIAFKKAVAKIKFGDFLIFRFLFDALGFSDSQSKSIGKSLGDSSSASDSTVTGLGKVTNDGSTASDTQAFSLSKALIDFSAMTDAQTAAFNKGAADSSAFTDAEKRDFYKFINEDAGVTDDLDGEATTDDDQEITFVKVQSNLATMVDAFAHSTEKGLSDTIGTNDSGYLRSQGYCAFDYFLEDYVGASQTF